MIKSIIKWSVIGLLLVPTTVKANEEIDLGLQEDVIESGYHVISMSGNQKALHALTHLNNACPPLLLLLKKTTRIY